MGSLLHLQDAHERAQLMLPWRINGTLEDAESALLEAHLAECAECRADLAVETALRATIVNMAPLCDPAEPARLPRLRRATQVPRTARNRLLARPIPLGWALAGPVAAAVALALFLIVPSSPPVAVPGYRLLGSNEPSADGNVIVLFAAEATERELRAALGQVGGRLVDGPTASGAYVIRVALADRKAAIERLRAMDQIAMAEPLDAGGVR